MQHKRVFTANLLEGSYPILPQRRINYNILQPIISISEQVTQSDPRGDLTFDVQYMAHWLRLK